MNSQGICARTDWRSAWRSGMAALLTAGGIISGARAAEVQIGAPVRLASGELVLTVAPAAGGLRLTSLYDQGQGLEFLGTNNPPLFTATFRHVGDDRQLKLDSDSGWGSATVVTNRGGIKLSWSHPAQAGVEGVAVAAEAIMDPARQAWHWRLRLTNPSPQWSTWEVAFPQLALASLGAEGSVVFPRGPGEVQSGVWDRTFNYHGNYPSGGCTMQFMAAYRAGKAPTGLYVSLNDPWGSTKDLALDSDPTNHTVRFRFNHPVPNMSLPANPFTLAGEAQWQILRGDWYDAAVIYRAWASREARWWPRLQAGERTDTVRWMRELNVWAMTGWGPSNCVPVVERFQTFLGLPLGFHWYTWHQIPFDNDYPHYFPAKPGFAERVAELQSARVFVMPYINGRLWDTHDRGADDFEFTRRALPAATKRPDHQPYLETYSSKEINGQPVRLAVMCPATPLWQQTVREIVLRLLREAGTKAVYIDQVAAAAPKLCMDQSHGHPLGGGHWWNEGYWAMLDRIRHDMPQGAMLTTECNAEPFIRWFDGYLTWHWQYDGQVPAFPAVYAGAIQMFGRAYRGGATKELALRMKAAQQLVFGEQLGWLDPELVNEPESAAYFKQVALVRSRLNPYFRAGQMVRPPTLEGQIPRVKADWQWSGQWWVTTDALLSGAWSQPRGRRLALIFANVSDQPVSAKLQFDPRAYSLPPGRIHAAWIRPDRPSGGDEAIEWPPDRDLTFGGRTVQALELSW